MVVSILLLQLLGCYVSGLQDMVNYRAGPLSRDCLALLHEFAGQTFAFIYGPP